VRTEDSNGCIVSLAAFGSAGVGSRSVGSGGIRNSGVGNGGKPICADDGIDTPSSAHESTNRQIAFMRSTLVPPARHAQEFFCVL
jgi:hypothetical protein